MLEMLRWRIPLLVPSTVQTFKAASEEMLLAFEVLVFTAAQIEVEENLLS